MPCAPYIGFPKAAEAAGRTGRARGRRRAAARARTAFAALLPLLALAAGTWSAAPAAAGEPSRPAWLENAVPWSAPPGTPLVAVVIDDLGPDRRRSARAAALAGPLTLSWLSYADGLPARTAAARANGHELLLHLPMEPLGEEDPGPGALLVRHGAGEIRRRVAAALSRFTGFVGANNHMGSRFTAEEAGMRVVLSALGRRGLLFLDSRTGPGSRALRLGRAMGVATVARDVFLDSRPGRGEPRARLREAERIARRTGSAIAIGHPRDDTLAALEEWIAGLGDGPVRLAPLSAVARARLGG